MTRPWTATKADLLVADDRAYFRAGAERERHDAFDLLRMRGLEHLTAGMMVEVTDPVRFDPRRAAEAVRRCGGSQLRFYLPADETSWVRPSWGLKATDEVALLRALRGEEPRPLPDGLTVRPATCADDVFKTALFATDTRRPDGKPAAPGDYTALERRKIDAGYMAGFLVEAEEEVAATFALSFRGGIVRMKNLFTSSLCRGRGCGAAIVRFAHNFALANGADALGVFAFRESTANRLYRREGLDIVGAQVEHCAPASALTAPFEAVRG